MKKTYIIPMTMMVAVQQQMVIAGSLTANGASGSATFYNANATGEAMVKGDNGSQSSYNVWDDDWSK